MNLRMVAWTPEDLLRRLDEVIAVYGDAMGYHDGDLAGRTARFSAHARRPGLRTVATLTEDGRLVGFCYGYGSDPGQWWHDQVHAALDEDARQRWLSDCFEVVELHVSPPAQGHGIGARQLRALLNMTAARTTLLSTPEADETRSRAWRLYRRYGFVDVLRNFLFPGDARPFAILGRTLPIDSHPGDATHP